MGIFEETATTPEMYWQQYGHYYHAHDPSNDPSPHMPMMTTESSGSEHEAGSCHDASANCSFLQDATASGRPTAHCVTNKSYGSKDNEDVYHNPEYDFRCSDSSCTSPSTTPRSMLTPLTPCQVADTSSFKSEGDDDVVCCEGCHEKILDRFYLLAVDRRWHAVCLKCCECQLPLESELTCFSRDGNIYCKEDYYRLFGVKRCARCHAAISSTELVMRARDFIYHVNCFTCYSCQVILTKGDHFGMQDNLVFCKIHYEMALRGEIDGDLQDGSLSLPTPFPESRRTCPPTVHSLNSQFCNGVGTAASNKGRPRKRKNKEIERMATNIGYDNP